MPRSKRRPPRPPRPASPGAPAHRDRARRPRQPGTCPSRTPLLVPPTAITGQGRARSRDRPRPAHNRRGQRRPRTAPGGAAARNRRRPRWARTQRDNLRGQGIRGRPRLIRLAGEPAPNALPALLNPVAYSISVRSRRRSGSCRVIQDLQGTHDRAGLGTSIQPWSCAS